MEPIRRQNEYEIEESVQNSDWSGNRLPIVLVGPTAVGKTAAAIKLAKRVDGEIVNADSMQVYKGMDIGTAKPSFSERETVQFHLLDVVSPEVQFTVSDWKELAEKTILEIHARNKQAIVCGGTGLYIRALLENWSLAETPSDDSIRNLLKKRAESEGSNSLHSELAEVDAKSAIRIHPNDVVRIIRALEVYLASGKRISEHQEEDRATQSRRPSKTWGLSLPRPELYARIEDRIDRMFEDGFETEVRDLLSREFVADSNAMKSLGYKETELYLQGDYDRAEAIRLIKQNTRRYSKRQMTWFNADHQIVWIDCSELNSAEIAARIA